VHEEHGARDVGLAIFTTASLLRVKTHSRSDGSVGDSRYVTAGMFRVTKLTPPGRERNPTVMHQPMYRSHGVRLLVPSTVKLCIRSEI
jgi:hypothetical protein